VLVPELKSAVRRLMCGAKVEWLRLVSMGKSGLNLALSPSGGQDAGKWVFYLEDEDRTSPRCHVLAVSHFSSPMLLILDLVVVGLPHILPHPCPLGRLHVMHN
jgi:hypothetical protein